jgi:hypothetical protein
MRSSVLSPMDPVAPRTEIRRGRTALVSISTARDVMEGSTRKPLLPNQQTMPGIGRIAERNERGQHCSEEQTIDPVKQPAMAGD